MPIHSWVNGEDATSESDRGASALVSAARSGRVLNKMSENHKAKEFRAVAHDHLAREIFRRAQQRDTVK